MKLQTAARRLGIEQADEVLRRLRAFYIEADRLLETEVDLPCKRGCDACCHEAVFLSAPEMLLVVDTLIREERLAEVAEPMLRLYERFEEDFEMLETLPKGAERDEVAARIKFRCPLLHDGACTVYGVRELNARSFGRSHDGERGEAYGCELTHERLRVLDQPPLFDAHRLRRLLVDRVPDAGGVRTYPQWFQMLYAED